MAASLAFKEERSALPGAKVPIASLNGVGVLTMELDMHFPEFDLATLAERHCSQSCRLPTRLPGRVLPVQRCAHGSRSRNGYPG